MKRISLAPVSLMVTHFPTKLAFFKFLQEVLNNLINWNHCWKRRNCVGQPDIFYCWIYMYLLPIRFSNGCKPKNKSDSPFMCFVWAEKSETVMPLPNFSTISVIGIHNYSSGEEFYSVYSTLSLFYSLKLIFRNVSLKTILLYYVAHSFPSPQFHPLPHIINLILTMMLLIYLILS